MLGVPKFQKTLSIAKDSQKHISHQSTFKVYLRLKPMEALGAGIAANDNIFHNSPRKSPSKSSTAEKMSSYHRRVTSVSPIRKVRHGSKDKLDAQAGDKTAGSPQKSKSLRTRTGSLNAILAAAPAQIQPGIRYNDKGIELLKNLASTGLSPGTIIKFPNVIPDDFNNQRVFDNIVQPMTAKALSGESYTLLTYGISGAGKSHTVFGTVENPGMLLRACQMLLSSPLMDGLGISLVEIYNEKVYDLLSPELKTLQVLETPHSESVVLPELTVSKVQKFADAARLVVRAQDRRVICPNMNNLTSSRSHVVVEVFPYLVGSSNTNQQPKLRFVDLAGSEKVSLSSHLGCVAG